MGLCGWVSDRWLTANGPAPRQACISALLLLSRSAPCPILLTLPCEMFAGDTGRGPRLGSSTRSQMLNAPGGGFPAGPLPSTPFFPPGPPPHMPYGGGHYPPPPGPPYGMPPPGFAPPMTSFQGERGWRQVGFDGTLLPGHLLN